MLPCWELTVRGVAVSTHPCFRVNWIWTDPLFSASLHTLCCWCPSHLSLTSLCYKNARSPTFLCSFASSTALADGLTNTRWSSIDEYSQKLEQIINLEIQWWIWELKWTLKIPFHIAVKLESFPGRSRDLLCGLLGSGELTSVMLFNCAVCKGLHIVLSLLLSSCY